MGYLKQKYHEMMFIRAMMVSNRESRVLELYNKVGSFDINQLIIYTFKCTTALSDDSILL